MNLKCSFLIFGLAVVAKAEEGYLRENPIEQLAYTSASQRYSEEDLSTGDEIPGEAGKDYPTFREIPETRFDCGQQQFPGYYADVEPRCQVYHICQKGGRKDSFLCPNGTVFNQEKLVCDWWFNSDCDQAQNFYSINEAVFRAMEDADRLIAEKNAAEGYRYNTPTGSRIQQQRPSSGNIHQSDFDTVVVEAARTAPRAQLSQLSQPQPQPQLQLQRQAFERPDVARRQPIGAYAEDNRDKNFQITGATFGKQISASARDAEVLDEPAREYLPAQLQRGNKY